MEAAGGVRQCALGLISGTEGDGGLEVVDGALHDGAVARVGKVSDVDEPEEDADGGDHLGRRGTESTGVRGGAVTYKEGGWLGPGSRVEIVESFSGWAQGVAWRLWRASRGGPRESRGYIVKSRAYLWSRVGIL